MGKPHLLIGRLRLPWLLTHEPSRNRFVGGPTVYARRRSPYKGPAGNSQSDGAAASAEPMGEHLVIELVDQGMKRIAHRAGNGSGCGCPRCW